MGIVAKECSLKPLVPYFQKEHPIDWHKEFENTNPLVVEIGFGLGEVMLRMAQSDPAKNFIGIEQNWERILKTLKKITQAGSSASKDALNNILILDVDARVAFERFFKPQSIDEVLCLFPCPWPKKDHVKHRLFSRSFLRLLNNRLAPKRTITIVTDFVPYRDWIKEQVGETGFHYSSQTVNPRFETKFEKKWIATGQREFYEIKLAKENHVDWPKLEEIELKAYRLKDFKPEIFKFTNYTGQTSVIFKEMLFDVRQQKAIIHLIVAEEHLSQHFWVTISKEESFWRLRRSDGQSFFVTPGIAKALELVYQSAVKTTAL